MKARIFWLAIALIVLAATLYFARGGGERAREAYIYRCNEEGAGGTFTSRQYCEELYNRGVSLDAPACTTGDCGAGTSAEHLLDNVNTM